MIINFSTYALTLYEKEAIKEAEHLQSILDNQWDFIDRVINELIINSRYSHIETYDQWFHAIITDEELSKNERKNIKSKVQMLLKWVRTPQQRIKWIFLK